CRLILKHEEEGFQHDHEAKLFTKIRFAVEFVNRQKWLAVPRKKECFLSQLRSITPDSRFGFHFLQKHAHGFSDCPVIARLNEILGTADDFNVRMQLSLLHGIAKLAGLLFRFRRYIAGLRAVEHLELTITIELMSGKR